MSYFFHPYISPFLHFTFIIPLLKSFPSSFDLSRHTSTTPRLYGRALYNYYLAWRREGGGEGGPKECCGQSLPPPIPMPFPPPAELLKALLSSNYTPSSLPLPLPLPHTCFRVSYSNILKVTSADMGGGSGNELL